MVKEKQPEKKRISVYLDGRLVEIVSADAKNRNLVGGVSEAIAHAVANAYGRPDLGSVPRKKMGRPFGTKKRKSKADGK